MTCETCKVRGKDWGDIKFQACMQLTKGGGEYADIYKVFEAGADAILEVLKREGSHLNGDTVIPARGEFPEIHCPGGMVGWLVFIPEEE